MKEAGSRRRSAAHTALRFDSIRSRVLLIVLAAAVIAAVVVPFVVPRRQAPAQIGYSEFIAALDGGRIAMLTIRPGSVVMGRWSGSTAASGEQDFVTIYPVANTASIADQAARAGVDVTFLSDAARTRLQRVGALTFQLLLVSVLCAFLFIAMRSQGLGGRVGQGTGGSGITFADVAGTQGADDELREIVAFLEDSESFRAMGARVPKGVLLYGPPGTGKTLLARAIAGEAGVPFFHLSGSEVTGFVVGLGAHRIRSLFARARKRGGVIFIDEIDALGGSRGSNRSHNEDDRTLNQLLVEMDGFAPSDGVVIIGATNRPDDLDPALKRPGRFDRFVTVGLPTSEGREAILRLHAGKREVPFEADVDLARLARLTSGSTGADLANLINEAAIAAVRSGAGRVAWDHIEVARDRILLGKERVGFRAHAQEWRLVAYHEAGHAIAGVVAAPEDGLHKVTIQPRGRAMGVAHFTPDDNRHLHSRAYLEAQIIKGLGGRAAEEMVFGPQHVTGGAESDLVQVNRIARRMVYRLGMSDSAGLLVHEPEAPLSADTQALMDADVRSLLERLYRRTREILEENRAALDALAERLLEKETMDGREAIELLCGAGVPVTGFAAMDVLPRY